MSACDGGETTIIREVPPGSAGETGSQGPASANPQASAAAGSDAPLMDEGFTAPVFTPLALPEPIVPTVVGMPGVPVDCALTLPCRWTSLDGAIGITVGSVDHLGSPEALTVDFFVKSTRDTDYSFTGAADVVTAGGNLSRPVRVALGQGNGVAPQPSLAGIPLTGQIVYPSTALDEVLTSWSITLDEAGIPLPAQFLQLPVAATVGVDVDCRNQLPCTWQTDDGTLFVTLTRAGGFSTARRLDIGFQIESTATRTIGMDAGSMAVANEGFQYTSRTHRLDGESGFGPITLQVRPGRKVVGSIDFFRSDVTSQMLTEVNLELFEDAPIPRWRPRFLNVPSIAP